MLKHPEDIYDEFEQTPQKKSGGVSGRILKFFLWSGLVLGIIGSAAIYVFYMHINWELPKIHTLKDYKPPVVSGVYSDDGKLIGEFCDERRTVVSLSEMPDLLKKAFVAAEDARFYEHEGIDFFSIVRAFLKNIKARGIVQGGSTITQQVTKSFFLSPEKSYRRKIKEAILASRIDKQFTKDEILFLYLNQIYLGNGAYGVAAAAESYFDKSVSDLTLAECALMAGLPQAPSRYSPLKHLDRAKQRQLYVLKRMLDESYITEEQSAAALNQTLKIKPKKNPYVDQAPYYTEYVRQYVEKKYGRDALYTQGLKIYTAVNVDMQEAARKAVEKGLRELDKRQGYRGPVKSLHAGEMEDYDRKFVERYGERLGKGMIVEGVVVAVDARSKDVAVGIGNERGTIPSKNMGWAGKKGHALKPGDVVLVETLEKSSEKDEWQLALEQDPEVQSALLCLEANTGLVKAMVGGSDFKKSQYNRAIQSRRQPGSAFKPVVYAAALDKGYTPASVILDTAVVFRDGNMVWKPKNYSSKFYGPTRIREALTHSRNLVTIKILRDIGIDYAIDYARKLGIESHLDRNLSLALGSSGVSLLELANAYAVFANAGYRIDPVFVTKIVGRDGVVLEEAGIRKEKVIESSTAYIMTSMLESVVKEGTGKRVGALNRPVAGKTGTTNDLYDAWFMGYTPEYVAGVWVGFDTEASLGAGETGGTAASPIWLHFMADILKDKPVRNFDEPEGVVFAKIDAETGLLPASESRNTYFEVFKEGTVPSQYTRKSESKSESLSGYDEFFKQGM